VADARMGVGRPHHRRIGHARFRVVGGVVALAGEKAEVLLAPHRLPDALARHSLVAHRIVPSFMPRKRTAK